MAERRSHPGRSTRRGVRLRTTFGAVLVVGLALLLGGMALVTLMQRAMEDNVRDAARLRARDVASTLESAGTFSSLNLTGDDDVFVQVTKGDSGVIASTPWVQSTDAVVMMSDGESRVIDGDLVGDDDPFVVVAEAATPPSGRVLVLVGRNLDLVVETTAVVRGILFVGLPVLLLLVAVTTWTVTGRALAPVESIRREVAEITSTADLHRRVPDPQGNDEVTRLARTMNDMLVRLERGQQIQQQLVSDASHELRNPIAAIRHHAEVALKHPESTSIRGLAGEVLEEDLRLQRIAEDLLLLAQVDERTLRLHFRALDLDDLVLEEARRLRRTTDLVIDTTGVAAARTEGDLSKLQRMLRNLADNAARHADGTVRFALRRVNGHVALEVDDDGPGIPEDSRERVFERFTRLDESRARGQGGAGLGLAIVTEVAAAHGGMASIESAPLGGARVKVVLPQRPTPQRKSQARR